MNKILSFSVAAAAAVASNANFESVGFDFEASDAIFADDEPSTANAGDNDNDDGEENADEDNDCDCSTCRERMRHKEELNRYILETVQDFLIKLGIKPLMHPLKISIFSLNIDIVRLTKIMNNIVKDVKILSFKVIFQCLKLVKSFPKKIFLKNI
jgi:hypothetical protein